MTEPSSPETEALADEAIAEPAKPELATTGVELARVPPQELAPRGPSIPIRALAWTSAALCAIAPVVSFWLAIVGAVGLVVAFLAFTIQISRVHRRYADEHQAGVAALSRGDLGTARAIFAQSATRPATLVTGAHSLHNFAWTLLRQGDLRGAIDTFLFNERRNSKRLRAYALLPSSAVNLALAYALLGDFARAKHWLAVLEQRKTERAAPSVPAMTVYARAVLALRRGTPTVAARLLDEHWAECEATLTGDVFRPLRVIRAFAQSASGPREAGIAAMTLAAARPAHPGEYAFLGADWPEMAVFLDAHGLR